MGVLAHKHLVTLPALHRYPLQKSHFPEPLKPFFHSALPKLWHLSFIQFGPSFISKPLRSILVVHSYDLSESLKGCWICSLREYVHPLYIYIYQSKEYTNPTQYFSSLLNGTLTNSRLKHCFIAPVNTFELNLTTSWGLECHPLLIKGPTCPQLCYIGNDTEL